MNTNTFSNDSTAFWRFSCISCSKESVYASFVVLWRRDDCILCRKYPCACRVEICSSTDIFLSYKVCIIVNFTTQYKTHQTLVQYKEAKGRRILLWWRKRSKTGHCEQFGPHTFLLVHSTFSPWFDSKFCRTTSSPRRYIECLFFNLLVRCFFLQWLHITVSVVQTLGEVKWVLFLPLPISF